MQQPGGGFLVRRLIMLSIVAGLASIAPMAAGSGRADQPPTTPSPTRDAPHGGSELIRPRGRLTATSVTEVAAQTRIVEEAAEATRLSRRVRLTATALASTPTPTDAPGSAATPTPTPLPPSQTPTPTPQPTTSPTSTPLPPTPTPTSTPLPPTATPTPTATPGTGTTVYVSDLPWSAMSNGWGPAERDMSNGETAAGDGRTLTLNGATYPKGVGAHAPSDILVAIPGACSSFSALVGVDDEVGANGTIVFQVYVDGSLRFDSGVMTGSSPAKAVSVSLVGASQLRLVVTDGGDGVWYDHADWADARLLCSSVTLATTTPTPTRTPTPTPGVSSSPSGQPMPVGDLPGWRYLWGDDFLTDVPLGSFPGPAYSARWWPYPDGWPDTSGKVEGSPSRYMPSKVVSVQNGVLRKYLHTENGTPMVAALVALLPSGGADQLYGRYSVRFRADPLPGYKTAWLLWPQSDNWPWDGEIDFPEGGLDGSICAFMHHQYATWGGDQDAFCTSTTYTSWHTATIEWGPSEVVFILDGQVIGRSTDRIPNTPMHWVLQTETCFWNCQPSASTAGYLEIDWAVLYARAN